ncbi:HK97 family phage prohead protease [Rhizobium sp. NLR22b]|uniref:HK97 family phage prohead protease n=1 Tax=Rhizobium sp. NLR22b TaxID=2731115 RepID=UPI001C830251|nr:HK97 family phage prohead protease [Rhizobium sp. NLR22b]MBX5239330.1 HK97 family phage prohead protease [Rhizobium sp. NLR22b]
MTTNKGAGAIEHRSFGLGELKVADIAASDGEMTFSGYGAVFNNVDAGDDLILKGAFAETIKSAKSTGIWPAMLSQHGVYGSQMTPIGVWTEMKEDDIGLYVEGKLANTERGREVYELLKMKPRPAISGLSIGYRAKEWTLRSTPTEPRRTLKAVDLLECSLVTFPMNGKARVLSVKSEFNPREIEDSLRDAGLSRADSVKAVAVFKSMLLRDEAEPDTDLRDEEEAAIKSDAQLTELAERIKALIA